MGQRIREYDWAATPVGPVSAWPVSLCNVVNIVISSRFPMFIWWGPELIQFYNDAYRPSLGNTGKHPTALGQRGEECWPEIWPVIYPLIRQVLDTGNATWSEDQLIPIYRNGRLEDVYWTFGYSPIIDENGRVRGVLVVCTENTGKVQSLQRLEESQDQLSFAIESAELGTWDYDPGTGKFSGNARLKSWFGLDSGEEIELALALEAMPPKDRVRVRAAIQRALEYESGGHYDIRYTIVNRRDRRERIVRAKGRAWFNAERVAYRFNGTLQDVTDQQTAHEQLEQAQNTARLAIESAALGVYELDIPTNRMITSERFNAIWEVKPPVDRNELIGKIHPENIDIQVKANHEALVTGSIHYEIRIILASGAERWVRIKGVVSYDEENKPATLTGITQDITVEKKVEEGLTSLVAARTAELQQSNEDLQQFAHVISHDLKEPVRKIRVFANRIGDELGDQLPAPGSMYLEKIQNAAVRMSSMIDGVLHYSSLSAVDSVLENIDLNEIMDNVRSDLEVLIQQKGARVSIVPLPRVYGIRVLIQQLFYNLINNSLKFSRKDVGPEIAVFGDPLATRPPGYTMIVVTDNGIGFDNEHAAHIFTNFTRLHSKDKYEGTGLGLALSKKIVERHGGKIAASSRPGEGAIFRLTLPLP